MQENMPFKKMKQQRDAFRQYFKKAEEEIDQQNLNILFKVIAIMTILTIQFTIITPYIIHSWRPSVHYFILILTEIAYLAYAWLLVDKKVKNHMVIEVSAISLMYYIIIGLSVIDIYPEPDTRSVFAPLFIAVAPALFVFPPRVMHFITITSELIFIVLVWGVKPELIAQTDIFVSIVGMMFGISIYYVNLKLRVEDHSIRMEYFGLAKIDGLTGVMNHEACVWEIECYLSEKSGTESSALLIIDVDNFKTVNDRFGHDKGDFVLTSFTEILKNIFCHNDIVGRFGGDEFIVFLKNINDSDFIREKCREINHAASGIMGQEMRVSCSIGIAVVQETPVTFKDLFKLADDNLYEAKAFGKAQFVMSEVHRHIPQEIEKPVMMVVDYSGDDRKILASAFSNEYEVIQMKMGLEALDFLNQNKKHVAVILLDVVMPGMDGFEVITYIKKRFGTSHIPIIVLSADSQNKQKALECGASDIIIKPFDLEMMKRRVRNVMKNGLND